MSHLHIPWVLLVIGCIEDPTVPPVEMTVDGLPATAVVTGSGTRQLVEISITPSGATLAGETLGMLSFTLDLALAPDCVDDCADLAMALEGQAATGHFVYGVRTFDIEPAPRAGDVITGPCPITEEGDLFDLPRGTVSGTINFNRLDVRGAQLSIFLAPTFGLGFPDPFVAHEIDIGELGVDFND